MSTSVAESLARIEAALGQAWLPRIYRERIRKMRTRSYQFPALPKNPAPQIHHTLLGIELKVGRQRMLCPDLATARYLSVFARLGCQSVAIPYDITRISQIADELESSWHRMLLLADQFALDPRSQGRIRRLLLEKVREEVAEAGTGARSPSFAHNTNKRRQ
jgi:hypothetical protein